MSTSILSRVIVLAIIALPTQVIANPWTRDAGKFYLNLNFSMINAGGVYGADFQNQGLPDIDGDGKSEAYKQMTLGFYTEVGVVDRRLMLTLDGTLMRRSELEMQGTYVGFGDLRLGLWTGLVTSPFRLTAGVLVGLPTGNPAPKADAVPGASADEQASADRIAKSLPTGDGEVDLEFVLALGYSFGGGGGFWPIRHYAVAQAGYWLRTSPRNNASAVNLPDAFNWKVEAGANLPWTFIDRFWFIGRVFGSEAFASSDEISTNPSGLGTTVYSAFAVEVFGRIWNGFGASFSLSGAFRAAGLPAGLNLRFALSYER
jgi:hypothetical protein